MTARTDRRLAPRARTPDGMHLRFPGLAEPAVVRDLSTSGVCCTMEQTLPLLSQVQVTFLLPSDGPERPTSSREVTCTGAVVRCARAGARYETAIFFTSVDDEDREALERYVTSLRRAGQVA